MSKIGSYVQQTQGHKAFELNKFPPQDVVSFDNSLIRLLSEANRELGGLQKIDALVPDLDFFIFMYVRKEAALSSQIEGTQATLEDAIKAEAEVKTEETPDDVDEIQNYIKAMNYGMERIEDLPLSTRLLKEMHKILLSGVRGKNKRPGEFKKSQNWIGGTSVENASFVPCPPNQVEGALSDLEKFIHSDNDDVPELIKSGLVHAQFETIHPFLDGNGCMGRLLITFYLYKKDILKRPLLYISEYFKKYRQEYYDMLDKYRKDEGVEKWIKFFLNAVKDVSREATNTALKIENLKEKHTKVVSNFGRNADTALSVLKYLYSQPIVNSKDVQKQAGVKSRSSASRLISKFKKAGILEEITDRKKNKIYMYKDYVDLF